FRSFEQYRLRVRLSFSASDGSDLFAKQVGAIVHSPAADREHPRPANALVRAFFQASFSGRGSYFALMWFAAIKGFVRPQPVERSQLVKTALFTVVAGCRARCLA